MRETGVIWNLVKIPTAASCGKADLDFHNNMKISVVNNNLNRRSIVIIITIYITIEIMDIV